jgi:aspartate 1-decarboxylase
MLVTLCTGKLHRVRVTEARLDYEGSITIDRQLMEAAGMRPLQLVHINNISNAAHWETYVIPGEKGVICLNGCPARLFYPGDRVIVLALAHCTPEEAASVQQKVVHVDSDNTVSRIEIKRFESSSVAK